MSRMPVAVRQLVTVVIALVVGGLIILVAGYNPFGVYGDMLTGAGFSLPLAWLPGNPAGIQQQIVAGNLYSTVNQWAALILLGLSAALPFRAGLFNIGSQGQYWLGAMTGVQLGLLVGAPLGLPVALLAALIGGAVAGLAAGLLKALRGANEVVSTIMINWLIVYLGHYLYGYAGPFSDLRTKQPLSPPFPPGLSLPVLLQSGIGMNAGILLAVLALAVFWVLTRKTTFGFGIGVFGSNPQAARYAGVPVKTITLLVLAIGGAFAGLAGAVQVLGTTHSISASGILGSSSFAFEGIAIALLGRNTTVGVLLGSLMFAALDSGSRFLAGSFPPELATALSGVLQAVIVLLVGAEALVDRFGSVRGVRDRVLRRRREAIGS